MSNATKTATVKIECTKCSGTGYIRAFSHVANGECFDCKAKGYFLTTQAKIDAAEAKAYAAIEPDTHKKLQWILDATDEQINRMTFRQISVSRSLVHWHWTGKYKGIRTRWFEKFGPRFGQLQTEKLDAWYAANPVG